jgi:hypothetical protein
VKLPKTIRGFPQQAVRAIHLPQDDADLLPHRLRRIVHQQLQTISAGFNGAEGLAYVMHQRRKKFLIIAVSSHGFRWSGGLDKYNARTSTGDRNLKKNFAAHIARFGGAEGAVATHRLVARQRRESE